MRSFAIILSLLFVSLAVAYPLNEPRTIDNDALVRLRCSLNPDQETMFFFNGTVYAFTPTGNTVLFKGVGVNVGRCFKKADGGFTLASRETMYYIDPTTDQIIDSWNNPWTGETGLTVVHVDNDPVLQQFAYGGSYNGMVLGDNFLLGMDVPLFYPNSLSYNPAFAAYSPQAMYQAAEIFKFIAPTAEVFGDVDTTSFSLVSWTRTGPFLPWMKQGNAAGYLLYSFHGSKIPDWTYLPAQVKADFANRVPHYKHAPTCIPNTASVSSWSFFSKNFTAYQQHAKFPLAIPAQYGCADIPLAPNTQCRATATLQQTNSWVEGGQTKYTYNIVIKNEGTKNINALAVQIDFTTVDSTWNINRQSNSNVYTTTIWGSWGAGVTSTGQYGFQSHGAQGVVSVASVSCN